MLTLDSGDPLATCDITLDVSDGTATDFCVSTVEVVDTTAPVAACNAPRTIVPPDAPISFTGTGADACSSTTTVVTEYDCFKFTKKGKKIDKKQSCVVSFEGDTITIDDSGGVHDHITWTVEVMDANGNTSSAQCQVLVVNPGLY
ncbi:MAG: hypothetical protein V3V08_17335 [Nannocystaceae bacterium]